MSEHEIINSGPTRQNFYHSIRPKFYTHSGQIETGNHQYIQFDDYQFRFERVCPLFQSSSKTSKLPGKSMGSCLRSISE